jgi:hypothetical protein
VACAADCAETAVQYIRSEKTKAATVECLRVCRAWAMGDATTEELRRAHNAYAAAADATYAHDAAHAAAHAAAAHAAARSKALRKMADIVRRHYPTAPVLP